MTPRTEALRRLSLDTPPSISAERAVLLTRFYRAKDGRLIKIPKHASALWRSSGAPGWIPYVAPGSKRATDPLKRATVRGWLPPDYLLLPIEETS